VVIVVGVWVCHVMVLMGVVMGCGVMCLVALIFSLLIHGCLVVELYIISIDSYYRIYINLVSSMATHSR
jgi:hypothetical protein